jgi:hypothetical protein
MKMLEGAREVKSETMLRAHKHKDASNKRNDPVGADLLKTILF